MDTFDGQGPVGETFDSLVKDGGEPSPHFSATAQPTASPVEAPAVKEAGQGVAPPPKQPLPAPCRTPRDAGALKSLQAHEDLGSQRVT